MQSSRSFLSEVACDLYRRYGDDISSLNILFPSRRARLFFLDALSSVADIPLWQPHWTTVDDLMTRISGLAVGDRLRLISELYKVYSHYHEESFDRFYFWGDMLLNDFDTIDKYLIDAEALFGNIADLKELEADTSYLTPEQRAIVERFWRNFADGAELSEVKRNFMALWRTLAPIYRDYRTRLSELGFGYVGMVHRRAAECIASSSVGLPADRYVIAGFNALSACEKRLFDYLKNTSEVDFYWDCDDYYLSSPEQEAGLFVRDNLARYGASGEISHDNLRSIDSVTAISAVSNVVQCKYVADILDELAVQGPLDKSTAIVLTDENLLEPLLWSLPESAGRVNVTMGYPLSLTPAFSFVERLLSLQSRCRVKSGEVGFYHTDVEGILSHPYLSASEGVQMLRDTIRRNRSVMVAQSDAAAGSKVFERLFRSVSTATELADYISDAVNAVSQLPCSEEESARRREFLTVVADEIAKLRNSLAECDIEMSVRTCSSLLRRHLRTVRIPFEGEPLEGVQVMGILETRNLDFRNVIILSMNDDNFPGDRVSQSSFIPYNLRFAYGMPTPEHHEGVYAYYFYRLVQRCENLYMLYCSHADEKSTGEPSRYIRQLEYESGIKVKRRDVGVDVFTFDSSDIEVPKCGSVAEALGEYLSESEPRKLSPKAFAEYVACPLRFYFSEIARLQPPDEITDTVDNRIFGNVFHRAVQNIYEPLCGRPRPAKALRAIADDAEAIDRAVVEAVNHEFLRDPSADPNEYSGDVAIVRNVLSRYLRAVLNYDARCDNFTVSALEKRIGCDFTFGRGDNGESLRVRFGGITDRLDMMDDGTMRVIDYKTGGQRLDFSSVEALFKGSAADRNDNIVKTILYAMMLSHSGAGAVLPTLYYVRSMQNPDYSPLLRRKDGAAGESYAVYAEKFEAAVAETLGELFNLSVPFRCCDDEKSCQYCNYRNICDR